MQQPRRINADDFRIRGEKMALSISLGLLILSLLVLVGISFGLILILIVIPVALVKVRQGQLLGQSIKVSASQLPEVHAAALRASERLSMALPDVFVVQNPVINAYALGFFGRKSVVLHSATVESMTPEELTFILGHEFSHIKCTHTHWTVITGSTESVRIPILSDLIGFLFLAWSRRAEYSSDRGGLVVGQNLNAAASALAKVAVGRHLFQALNLDGLFGQRSDVQGDAISRFSEAMATHPYIVNRLYSLQEFSRSDRYNDLTSGAGAP